MSTVPFEILSTKELSNASNTNTQAYPSPSLSPVTTFRNTMNPAFAVTDSHHRSSIKYLMGSINPPASPLDALVLALEATAEELKGGLDENQPSRSASPLSQEHESEEDPNATVPSSPTFFMKKTSMLANSDVPSLHQLPSLVLPEAAFSSQASPPSASYFPTTTSTSTLTPSTQPGQTGGNRKMSISSQGSVDSTSSAASSGGRRKTCVCSVANCEKRFSQVAHLRIHERYVYAVLC
ncbi:hypothetical protein BGZ58_008892 [Dissophora ornata]|nr:hypothetical protein BGZ58_008892 [Dissophora ornata]